MSGRTHRLAIGGPLQLRRQKPQDGGNYLNESSGKLPDNTIGKLEQLSAIGGERARTLLKNEKRCPSCENESLLYSALEEAEIAHRAKARFLAIMSHEIRTALNSMLGVVSLLGQTRLDPEQERLASMAEEAGRSLLGVINNILDFSKLEAGKHEIEHSPFRLDLLIDTIVNMVRPQVEKKGLELICNISNDVNRAFVGDADRIRQVLLNLVWNAIKFTSIGGITLTVEGTETENPSLISFSVADTGIGVPAEKRTSLFGEFVTITQPTDNEFQGTGLGLSISKAFVDAMGGNIGYENLPSGGSKFSFEVPLEKCELSAIEEPGPEEACTSLTALKGMRILVADDNQTNQLIVKRYLTRAGAKVDIASDGKEAVEMFRPGHHDLVLMDISMPRMDGYDATAAIRFITRNQAHVPVVAFTAYATTQDRARVFDAGLDGYITKPFSQHQLISAITQLLPDCHGSVDVAAVREIDEADLATTLAVELELDEQSLLDLFTGMKREDVMEIFFQFLSDLDDFATSMQTALERSDNLELERTSHGIKGACGLFGAMQLRDLSESVNNSCRKGASINNEDDVNEILHQSRHLVGAGRKLLTSVSQQNEQPIHGEAVG